MCFLLNLLKFDSCSRSCFVLVFVLLLLFTQSCPTLCDLMDCSTPSSTFFTISWSLPKLMSIDLVMPSSHLVLCCPLLLLPSIFPSIRVFSNESALGIRWPKYWSFSFSISPSNEHSGLISFRMDWFDRLVVQGLSRLFWILWVSFSSILIFKKFEKIIRGLNLSSWENLAF